MKNFKYFLSFILLILLVFTNGFEVFAMNTGFEIDYSFSEEEKEHIISVNHLKLLKEEPVNEAIQCFDVNEDGLIAIGLIHMDEKYICIYSSDGIFQYGYRFDSEGAFGIEFNDEYVNIYFARSEIVVSVNPEGKIIEIAQVQDTSDNNRYSNYVFYNRVRESGDKKYVLKNDTGFLNLIVSSYSQLAVIDSDGNEKIIYDVNSKMFARRLVTFITVFLLVVFTVSYFTITIIKNIKKYNKEEAEKAKQNNQTQWNISTVPLEKATDKPQNEN